MSAYVAAQECDQVISSIRGKPRCDRAKMMTSLERVRAVIAGGIPDRVPVCLLSFQNAAFHAGIPVAEYCLDGRKMAQAQLGYWDEFRHDMIQIENGIAALAEAVGCTVEYAVNEPPWVTRPAIQALDMVDTLQDINLGNSPGIAALLDATRTLSEKVGQKVCIRGDADQGPFSLAAQMIGAEELMVALMDPDQHRKVHKLLSYATEQVVRLARAQFMAGSHLSVIGDSIAGPDVCSPGIYAEFAAPYEKAVIDRLRRDGFEVGIHICGDATPIMQSLMKTGVKYVELDYKVDRPKVRQVTDGKATVIGTIDPSNLLPHGQPAEIAAKAVEDIRILGGRGRFILGPGCTIPRDTPVGNVRALVEAALTHGRYDRDNLVEAG